MAPSSSQNKPVRVDRSAAVGFPVGTPHTLGASCSEIKVSFPGMKCERDARERRFGQSSCREIFSPVHFVDESRGDS
jgi:hypothetical protein